MNACRPRYLSTTPRIQRHHPRQRSATAGWLGCWALCCVLIASMVTADEARIPTLHLQRLQGDMETIEPDPERNTLVYLFAPWCGICRHSIGNLDAVDTDATRIVVIALDYKTVPEVKAFIRSTGVEHPVYLGTEEHERLFAIEAYPTYFVLDNAFRVRHHSVGYSTSLGLKFRTR